MDKEKPLPENKAEMQFTESVQRDAELSGEDMKDTENKELLEKTKDISKVQEPKKVANKKKKDHQDETLRPWGETSTVNPLASVPPRKAAQAVATAESEEEGELASTTPVENEPSLKTDMEGTKKQEKEIASPKLSSPDTTVIEDFTQFSKEKLVTHIAGLQKDTDLKQMANSLRNLKARFDELFEESKALALGVFLKEEGVEADDFFYKGDEVDQKFESIYHDLNKRKNQHHAQIQDQREENLKKKNLILDQLRDISNNNFDIDIKVIKGLQQSWQDIGPVPGNQHKLLWANYNALLDRFYDSRSIYFELKDLDRKKNLMATTQLCEKAEKLSSKENSNAAIKELNELHEEYKKVGPVPRDEQENLWQRFKLASDKVYEKRKEFIESLKSVLLENLEKKRVIILEVQKYEDFDSEKITDWNKAATTLMNFQKEWEAIGKMPREKSKEANKLFWGAFKKFFSKKRAFIQAFESKKDSNLITKRNLIEQAQSLVDSDEDSIKISEGLKLLQQNWREIGPVPNKYRNKIYDQFKGICDTFFDQKRSVYKVQNADFEVNLNKKKAVIDQLSALAKSAKINFDEIFILVDAYMAIGFVPRNDIKKINGLYDETINSLIIAEGITDGERNKIKIQLEMSKLKKGPQSHFKLNQKEGQIKKKISSLENDINIWKTNIDFFASSKNADKLKLEFNQKIESAEKGVIALKEQLLILREA
ncbi:MAG: hypothetical protein CMB93_02255 [Flammeovirgaceae bacterium]|nr:hypothetical protein [Flammeovirgaceae bacterium]